MLDGLQEAIARAGPDRDVRDADALEGVERGAGDERPGVVGRRDPVAGGETRGGVAARRAGHPVLEVAGRERDVARRARRPARRVDPDELARLHAEVRAERVLRRARRLELGLLGERELRDLRQAARRVEARELLAVEGRPLEEVGELAAVARVVERELLRPRPRLDLIRRTRSPPRPPWRAGIRSAVPAPRRGARAGSPCGRGSAPPSRLRTESRDRASPPRSAWRRSSSAPPLRGSRARR